MKQCMRMSWLALAALACASLLWPATTLAVQKEKDKVYEVGGGDGLKIESKLTADDTKDKVRMNSYAKVYLVKLQENKTYTIRLNSPNQMALDPYLRVEDAESKQLAFNDDDPDEMGKTLNSKLEFKAPKTGTYRIIATTFAMNQTGDFTLLIKAN